MEDEKKEENIIVNENSDKGMKEKIDSLENRLSAIEVSIQSIHDAIISGNNENEDSDYMGDIE